MPKEPSVIHKPNDIDEIYVYDTDHPTKKELTYCIDKRRKHIKLYVRNEPFLKEIVITGFPRLPKEFSERGYIKGKVDYYIKDRLSAKKVKRLTISRYGKDSFRKVNSNYRVVLSYQSFKLLRDRVTSITNEAKLDRSQTVNEFFHKVYPRKYPRMEIAPRRRVSKVIKNLDRDIIKHLNASEVQTFLDFFEFLLSSKYKSAVQKRHLLSSAKIKVDDLTLNDIVASFEKMLEQNPPERKWGDFLKKNLFLLDSKYIKAIPELNVVLATARRVDFALVDSQGYLDIFEMKRPSTPLLAKSTDHGNYYWSVDAVRAIVQAEKYLYHAERKASGLSEGIERENDINVKVIKPRAIVVMGCTSQLDHLNKENDFRVLRMSLKNVEVVLYDELLLRLKNQMRKIYIE